MMLKEAKPAEFKRTKYSGYKKSQRVLLCKRQCEVCHRMTVHWEPNKCSMIELTLEDSDSD